MKTEPTGEEQMQIQWRTEMDPRKDIPDLWKMNKFSLSPKQFR